MLCLVTSMRLVTVTFDKAQSVELSSRSVDQQASTGLATGAADVHRPRTVAVRYAASVAAAIWQSASAASESRAVQGRSGVGLAAVVTAAASHDTNTRVENVVSTRQIVALLTRLTPGRVRSVAHKQHWEDAVSYTHLTLPTKRIV